MWANSLVIGPLIYQPLIFHAFISQEIITRASVPQVWIHRDDWIEENGEVRASIILSMGADRRSQMASSREAHDTNILLVDMPNSGTVSHRTHSLISIAERNVMVAMRHTILQDKEGDALLIEILSPLMSLMIQGEMSVTATRTIHHSTSRRILRQITSKLTIAIGTILKHKLSSRRLG